jgi:hydrogenase/urease accessory protein HupE
MMLSRFATAGVLLLIPVAAAAHSPFPSRGYLENGLVHTLVAPDQVVPLIALGIGLTGAPHWRAMPGFALAAAIGIAVADPLAIHAIAFLGPGLLGAGGLALLAPQRWSAFAAPVLVAIAGFTLGLAVYADGPEDDGWLHFAIGAVLSGGWAVAMAALLWRRLAPARLEIPRRIAGSWLVAIAVLLAGAALNPRLRIDVAPGEVAVPDVPPGLDQSRQP